MNAKDLTKSQPSLQNFHPAIAAWFSAKFAAPTAVQVETWPLVAANENVLATAPTGSGKTLTAFLWALNAFATGRSKTDATRVLYLSPLKALNNDIRRNLLGPLTELQSAFAEAGETFPAVRVRVRSGDTPQGDRQKMLRSPPEILITTPESLMLLLTTARGRRALATIETVIVDEIHSIVDNRRGAQLMISLERLAHIAGDFQRIALSATVKPLETVARYVAGYDAAMQPRQIHIVQPQISKDIALKVRFPEAARHAADNGQPIWDPLGETFRDTIDGNRSTLFFANSRRLAEKITLKINETSLAPVAYAHHGSLARDVRTDVESRLKAGELKAIVATNSLEMGIDIGALDEVVMVQSPPSIASTLQRIGRAGHQVGETSRGSIFPTHPQDFLEAAVLARAVNDRDIEPLVPISNALDVLAQIIVSMVANEAWQVDDMFTLLRRAEPYHTLSREHFDLVVDMLAGRYAGTRIRDLKPRVAFDRVNGTLRAQKGAVFALYNSGGTIPDRGYFQLRHADSGTAIGELDEEFVWEATIGQTFTLGTQNWQIQRITHNDVLVRQAPPSATAPPFWRSETINRSFHFSALIGDFLHDAEAHLSHNAVDAISTELTDSLHFEPVAATELTEFLQRQREHTDSALPHRHHVVIEHIRSGPGGYRGPDDEQQIVLHTMWGGRVNRPFALALETAWRERFGGEAEIFADNNCVVAQVKGGNNPDPTEALTLVTSANLDGLLRAALEGSGFFGARFRECAGRALLLTRQRFNQRLPLWMSRLQAKKLMTATKQLADFPVLLETWRTCLAEEFDLDALQHLLGELASGETTWSIAHTATPSPFAANVAFDQIGRYMYADDSPESSERSNLANSLINDAVHNQSLRPLLRQEIIDQFEAKSLRTAAGYHPSDQLDLSEWLKARVAVPEDEWLILRGEIDLPGGVAEQVTTDNRRFFVHSENVRTLCRALDLQPDHTSLSLLPEIADDSRTDLDLISDCMSFYGARTEQAWLDVLPVDRPRLQELVSTMVESGALIQDIAVSDTDVARVDPSIPANDPARSTHDHIADAANLETLLRFQRAANRSGLTALPADRLPAFLAHWQHFGKTPDPNTLADTAEQLRQMPAAVRFWLRDAWHARFAGITDADVDQLFADHGLTWRGAGSGKIAVDFEDTFDLIDTRPGKPVDDGGQQLEGTAVDAQVADGSSTTAKVARLFRDPLARYPYNQLVDEADQLKLSGKLTADPGTSFNDVFWDVVWAGDVAADSIAPLRAAEPSKYKVPEQSPSRHRSRSRARFASRGWSGNWYLTSRNEAPSGPLDRLERAKEVVRTLLDRYGVIARELANREDGPYRWARIFAALRVMELSGEIVTGHFFEGLSGPQFALPLAIRHLERGLGDASWWINATDPASPCGLGLDWPELPQRRPQNYLAFHAGELSLVLENDGKRLTFLQDPDDDATATSLPLVAYMARQQRRIAVSTINGEPAKESPYLDPLRRHVSVVTDHRGITLENLKAV